jgi:hypothetical protein
MSVVGILGRFCRLFINGYLVQSVTDESIRWEPHVIQFQGRGQAVQSDLVVGETREIEFSVIDIREATYLANLAASREPVQVVCTAHAIAQAADAINWRTPPQVAVETFFATFSGGRATAKPLDGAVSTRFALREWGHPVQQSAATEE